MEMVAVFLMILSWRTMFYNREETSHQKNTAFGDTKTCYLEPESTDSKWYLQQWERQSWCWASIYHQGSERLPRGMPSINDLVHKGLEDFKLGKIMVNLDYNTILVCFVKLTKTKRPNRHKYLAKVTVISDKEWKPFNNGSIVGDWEITQWLKSTHCFCRRCGVDSQHHQKAHEHL